MTMTAVRPASEARQALQARACVPACVLSEAAVRRCHCRCGGAFHGIAVPYLGAPEQPAAKPDRATRGRMRKGRRR